MPGCAAPDLNGKGLQTLEVASTFGCLKGKMCTFAISQQCPDYLITTSAPPPPGHDQVVTRLIGIL